MGIQFTLPEFFKRYSKDQTVEELESIDLDALAHAQQKVEHDLTRWQAAKRYKNVCFYTFVIVWTMVMWGYEGTAGAMLVAIPQFREDFGYEYEGSYVLEAKWQSAISGGPAASMTVAFILGSYFSDIFGRRKILLVASMFSLPWITIQFVATSIELFFAGKFMNGFALGALSACCSTYISEISPLALRGISSTLLSISMSTGPFICVLINNTTSTYTSRMAYRGIFIPQWVFACTAIMLQCFIPESPYWLLSKDRKKDAIKNLRRMFDNEADVQAQYALMSVTVEEAKAISSKAGTYIDCFRKKDFRRTWLTAFAFVMQAFSGVAYVGSYSTYYFELSGFDTQKSFSMTCVCQALSISGVITAIFLVDRVGRRKLLITGMILITICNLLVACLGLNKSNQPAMTASSAFLILYNYIYNIGIGPVPYILGNELSSVFLRAKTISMGNALNNAMQTMWSVVLPYMFNTNEGNMGSKINFIFTGLSFVSIFIFYIYLPETAHRSFEEIDEMFALGIPARHWASYKTEKEAISDKAFADVKTEENQVENNMMEPAEKSSVSSIV
uniref:MFS transporter n=1 Tax=Cyberlindnera americana TaxID=36016 RepID=A0A5P8N8E9_9ASCO|nr:MFS transporter [Cyberlindnera americana]